jgi:hypothetical protein
MDGGYGELFERLTIVGFALVVAAAVGVASIIAWRRSRSRPAAGWFPDPWGQAPYRWFDRRHWTRALSWGEPTASNPAHLPVTGPEGLPSVPPISDDTNGPMTA